MASVTGLSTVRADRALRTLEEASLVEQRWDRFAMHDLVREYAVTIVRDLPEGMQDAASVRLMDCYLHTAFAADRLLDPHSPLLQLDRPPAAGVCVDPLSNDRDAAQWLRREHTALMAAQRAAVALGRHHVVWHLAWALDTYHGRS